MGTTVGRVPTRPGFTYRLNSDEAVFSLDPVTGELSTRARLDREDTPGGQFDLIVLSSSPTYPIEVSVVLQTAEYFLRLRQTLESYFPIIADCMKEFEISSQKIIFPALNIKPMRGC